MRKYVSFFLIFILSFNFIYALSAYGYKMGVGPCQIVSPVEIRILSYQGEDYFAGASWANGRWYAVTHLTHNLITCDTITGQNTIIGNIGTVTGEPVALCWDPSTGIMYMLTAAPNSLYSININNGVTSFISFVNPFSQYNLLSGVIANNGSFFAILHRGDNANPFFLKINKTNGDAQFRGEIANCSSQGPQGISFDRHSGGFLWWIRYRSSGESVLIRIDTTSAQFTPVANMLDSSQIDGLIFTDNIVGVNNLTSAIPDGYTLFQNYPNPFNPLTNIKFEIPGSSYIKLAVYDIFGREVSLLINSKMNAGIYNATWDAGKYSSGIYYYRLTGDNFTDVKKMILVK